MTTKKRRIFESNCRKKRSAKGQLRECRRNGVTVSNWIRSRLCSSSADVTRVNTRKFNDNSIISLSLSFFRCWWSTSKGRPFHTTPSSLLRTFFFPFFRVLTYSFFRWKMIHSMRTHTSSHPIRKRGNQNGGLGKNFFFQMRHNETTQNYFEKCFLSHFPTDRREWGGGEKKWRPQFREISRMNFSSWRERAATTRNNRRNLINVESNIM